MEVNNTIVELFRSWLFGVYYLLVSILGVYQILLCGCPEQTQYKHVSANQSLDQNATSLADLRTHKKTQKEIHLLETRDLRTKTTNYQEQFL